MHPINSPTINTEYAGHFWSEKNQHDFDLKFAVSFFLCLLISPYQHCHLWWLFPTTRKPFSFLDGVSKWCKWAAFSNQNQHLRWRGVCVAFHRRWSFHVLSEADNIYRRLYTSLGVKVILSVCCFPSYSYHLNLIIPYWRRLRR